MQLLTEDDDFLPQHIKATHSDEPGGTLLPLPVFCAGNSELIPDAALPTGWNMQPQTGLIPWTGMEMERGK